jgi:hypothetical protein
MALQSNQYQYRLGAKVDGGQDKRLLVTSRTILFAERIITIINNRTRPADKQAKGLCTSTFDSANVVEQNIAFTTKYYNYDYCLPS